jgi:hypothetical protein
MVFGKSAFADLCFQRGYKSHSASKRKIFGREGGGHTSMAEQENVRDPQKCALFIRQPVVPG